MELHEDFCFSHR